MLLFQVMFQGVILGNFLLLFFILFFIFLEGGGGWFWVWDIGIYPINIYCQLAFS